MGSKGEKLTIVGAGPVGSLLATVLARRGHEVTLLESRGDMRRETVAAGRSINLAVSVRGIEGLKRIGADEEVLRQAIPMYGRMMHAVDGKLTFQQYGKDATDCINSLSRGELNEYLMSAAEKAGAKIHFHHRVTDADLPGQKLKIKGREELFPFHRVIGTDGSASALRKAMVKHGTVSHETELEYGYKELTMPAGKGGTFLMEKNALHIWPRGSFMLIALPNFEGSYTCTLFLPFARFDELTTPAQVESFFGKEFPDALKLIPGLSDQFFEHPTGHMVTVKCSPWNFGSKALLVGDAAHAIVPFFGQGMNCGFEDVTRIAEHLDQGMSWDELFPRFGVERKADADAIADMAVENFVEMRDKVGDPKFLLAKEVEKLLQNWFPGEYVSRYQMVTFSQVPYRKAKEVGEVEDAILSELCRGLTSPEQVDREKASRLIHSRLATIRA